MIKMCDLPRYADADMEEIKKMKESTSCVQRMPKNVTLRASSLLVV